MRITFLSHFPGRGGSTSMLMQLVRFFGAEGDETTVVVGSDSPDAQVESYQVFQPSPGAGWRRRLREYRALVESTRPDLVYHVSGVEEADLLRFLPFPRVRHVFTLEQHERLNTLYWLGQLGAYWEACTANTPDVIEAVRSVVPHDFHAYQAPYRLDPVFYGTRNRAPGLDRDRAVEICCIGRIETYQKRMEWFPEIVHRCRVAGRNFVWHMYGAGPAEAMVRAALDRLGCIDIVRMHGWTGSEELARSASLHDLYFSCSRFDGLPVAMQEAMFCGLACLAPDMDGGIRYVIREGGAWGYNASSPGRAVSALLERTAKLEEIEQQKRRTRRRADELFGLEILRARYEELRDGVRRLRFNGRVADLERARKIRLVRLGTYLRRRLLSGFARVNPR